MKTVYVERSIPKILAVKALKKVWPGVVYSKLSPARLAKLPDPPIPGPRGVRVENILSGICATDISILCGDADPSTAIVSLPGNERIYLGHEVVGKVTEIGPDIQSLAIGDRVVLDTCFKCATCASQEITPPCTRCQEGNHFLCENACLGNGVKGVGAGFGDGFTCHEAELVKVPDQISDEQAMLTEPFTVGMRAAMCCRPKSGERVLVLGAGIIGITVANSIKAVSPDCHLCVVARYPHQVEAAKQAGADEVIQKDIYQATKLVTGAKLYKGMFGNRMLLGGFDIIHDCVGSGESLTDCLRLARARGTVVLVGAKIAPVNVDLTPVWYQEVSLIGSYAHGHEDYNGERISTIDLVFKLFQQGKLKDRGLVTNRFPLEQWKDALSFSMDKTTGVIKVALEG
jgi:threonine dehydrogenase-like Zn-dependent dehydrogenase